MEGHCRELHVLVYDWFDRAIDITSDRFAFISLYYFILSPISQDYESDYAVSSSLGDMSSNALYHATS